MCKGKGLYPSAGTGQKEHFALGGWLPDAPLLLCLLLLHHVHCSSVRCTLQDPWGFRAPITDACFPSSRCPCLCINFPAASFSLPVDVAHNCKGLHSKGAQQWLHPFTLEDSDCSDVGTLDHTHGSICLPLEHKDRHKSCEIIFYRKKKTVSWKFFSFFFAVEYFQLVLGVIVLGKCSLEVNIWRYIWLLKTTPSLNTSAAVFQWLISFCQLNWVLNTRVMAWFQASADVYIPSVWTALCHISKCLMGYRCAPAYQESWMLDKRWWLICYFPYLRYFFTALSHHNAPGSYPICLQ